VIETHDIDRIYALPRSTSRVLRDSTQVVQVNCILLSKGHYMYGSSLRQQQILDKEYNRELRYSYPRA
jgi:hypothetical protein